MMKSGCYKRDRFECGCGDTAGDNLILKDPKTSFGFGVYFCS